jgi:tellurite methyltransferase
MLRVEHSKDGDMDAEALRSELAGMDIYLLDEVLKGRFPAGCSILDAGCGAGRNLIWFARNGYDVHAADADADSVAALKVRTRGLVNEGQIRRAGVGELPYAEGTFDTVLCIAVLHFMKDEDEWHRAVNDLWRVLKPGGLLFARFGTTITIEQHLQHVKGRRYRLPNGMELYYPDLQALLDKQAALGAEQLEPIKTVNVQHRRTMSNWVLRKPE